MRKLTFKQKLFDSIFETRYSWLTMVMSMMCVLTYYASHSFFWFVVQMSLIGVYTYFENKLVKQIHNERRGVLQW